MRLTDDQVALLQAFIDELPAGEYDAMDLVPEQERQYFAAPQAHGSQFYRAVQDGRLKRIEFVRMDRNSKHLRYAIHGG